jgi:hypothetical protein
MIDAVWGPGLPGPVQQGIMLGWMTKLEQEFACFINHDVDVQGNFLEFLPEVGSGVSKGRFHAIMTHLTMQLQNGHTSFSDREVSWTQPEPGVPLLVGHQYMTTYLFGACLTTDDEGNAWVYEVVDNHPLGLEVGDIILGYEGIPWEDLLQKLMEAQLPVSQGWLTSDASYEYGWATAVGNNWHLFDTIDIQKFRTGQVVNLPTEPLVNPAVDLAIYCSDQINDQMERPTDPEWVTWDVLEDGESRIGFIWSEAWIGQAQNAWEQACQAMVEDPDLDGLIIDFRNNIGGNMYMSNYGLSHLFDAEILTIEFAVRPLPEEHLVLMRTGGAQYMAIPGNPNDYFDKPIAVLLGPKTISSGDFVAQRMTYHPEVRTFGRQTSCTFDSPVGYQVPGFSEDFAARFSQYNSGRVELPDDYLSSLGFPVDQEVWLDPVDAFHRRDSVIEAAKDWIRMGGNDRSDGKADQGSQILSSAPNPANPRTVISFSVSRGGPCEMKIYDVAGRRVMTRSWTHLEKGLHTFAWEGTDANGRGVSSGPYFAELEAPDRKDRTRITLLK